MGFLKKFTNYENFVIKSKSKFEKIKLYFVNLWNIKKYEWL